MTRPGAEGDYVSDDASIQDQTDNLTEASGIPPAGADLGGVTETHEDLPERLRVHSLARVLGTTSRRVLDALSELDGRTRSAHSSVDRTDAVRVRDVLAQEPEGAEPAEAPTEPESRLLLETPEHASAGHDVEHPADYLPLFVAPQPVEVRPVVLDEDADDVEDGDAEDA